MSDLWATDEARALRSICQDSCRVTCASSRKRFEADLIKALRRCHESAAATPCSGWSVACPQCKYKGNEAHHIFCENRGGAGRSSFKTAAEITLAAELRRRLLRFHRELWAGPEVARPHTKHRS